MYQHFIQHYVIILLEILVQLFGVARDHDLDNLGKISAESGVQALLRIFRRRWLVKEAEELIDQGVVLFLLAG